MIEITDPIGDDTAGSNCRRRLNRYLEGSGSGGEGEMSIGGDMGPEGGEEME